MWFPAGLVLLKLKPRGSQPDLWLVLQAGGQGHADVAVTCLLPLDEGHLKAPAEELPRAKLNARVGSPFQRALNTVAASAAEAAKGFIKDVLGRSAPSPCRA